MNDDQFNDLKQFIDGRIGQSEKRLKQEIIDATRTEIHELRDEMRDGLAGVADTIEDMNSRYDNAHAGLDRRVTKLEQQAA